eukprot:134783_1
MATEIKDIVFDMNVTERVHHVIHGLFRQTMNKNIYPPIVQLCYKYCGIDKYHNYHLIISNTELVIITQQEAKKQEKQQYIKHLSMKFMKNKKENYNEIQVIVMGLHGVGKHSIMNRFIANCFVEEYDPTIEDGYRKQTMVGEAIFIWDIIHSSDYDTICQSIPFGHIFIFVYAINSRYSFQKMAQFIQQTENTLK